MRIQHTIWLICLTILISSFSTQNQSADEFIDFTAYVAGSQINVQWTLKTQGSLKSLAIERSTDGRKFQLLTNFTENIPSIGNEFIEADLFPATGWSYYRITQLMNDDSESKTHSIPVYYEVMKSEKGVVKSGDPVGSIDVITYKMTEFDGLSAVFVLRNNKGLEFYHESTITVVNDNIELKATAALPAGRYNVTACSQNPLVGLQISVK